MANQSWIKEYYHNRMKYYDQITSIEKRDFRIIDKIKEISKLQEYKKYGLSKKLIKLDIRNLIHNEVIKILLKKFSKENIVVSNKNIYYLTRSYVDEYERRIMNFKNSQINNNDSDLIPIEKLVSEKQIVHKIIDLIIHGLDEASKKKNKKQNDDNEVLNDLNNLNFDNNKKKITFIRKDNLITSNDESSLLKSIEDILLKENIIIPDQEPSKTTISKYYNRDKIIAKWAKYNSRGYCNLCKEKAPFKDNDGNPYLEEHHILPLSDGGKDSINNVVALCPNCHKKMHIKKNKDDIHMLQKIATDNYNILINKIVV